MSRLLVIVNFIISFNVFSVTELNIAVASNFEDTLIQMGEEFSSDLKINVTSASSAKLTAQILAGRKFDLFFSADQKNTSLLKRNYALGGKTYTYAHGRIIFVGSERCEKSELLKIIGEKRTAIASPKLAPYGFATLSFLKGHNITSSKLIFGSNVKQVGIWLKSGAIKHGFIAGSMKKYFTEKTCLIAIEDHPPIIQDSIILSSSSKHELSRKFLNFILNNKSKLNEYGYY